MEDDMLMLSPDDNDLDLVNDVDMALLDCSDGDIGNGMERMNIKQSRSGDKSNKTARSSLPTRKKVNFSSRIQTNASESGKFRFGNNNGSGSSASKTETSSKTFRSSHQKGIFTRNYKIPMKTKIPATEEVQFFKSTPTLPKPMTYRSHPAAPKDNFQDKPPFVRFDVPPPKIDAAHVPTFDVPPPQAKVVQEEGNGGVSKYDLQNIASLKNEKMQQEVKMRVQAEKLKAIEDAITKKQEEEEDKIKMQMMMKGDGGMSGIMAKMMEQQMEMMMLMTNNMVQQSKLFSEEIRKLDGQRQKGNDSPALIVDGVFKRVGRPNVKMAGNPYQFRGPTPATIQPGSSQFQSRMRSSYKPYQYPSRATKPDFISNGTKKKAWFPSKMPDDLVLCEITDDGPVPAKKK